MALRDQPYIPLFVQDFLTDEKLIECSALATGVYIRLMCLMHKSDEYGVILLKQKDKQTSNSIENFALKLVKSLPYSFEVIFEGLSELIEENVLTCQDDKLIQRRMVKDNSISVSRSEAGKKGGGNPNFVKTKLLTTVKTKVQTNSEYENEYENENGIKIPSLLEVESYFKTKGYNKKGAEKFFNYYTETSWNDKDGKPVKNWKLKAVNVWFRDEYKIKSDQMVY